MTCRCDSNPAQYERNRRFGHLVHALGRAAGGAKLPSVGLCLNTSKAVSFLVKDFSAPKQFVWTCTKNAIGCCAGPTVRGERGVRWSKQCVRICAFRATRPDLRRRCKDTPVEQQRHASDAYGLVRVTIPPVAAAYEQE
ncbi:unnamed protein product [Trichogramma brassicae]|uniref:Uncharacterized protein n=1 Tax=Trichogramma brassicae TaxID=86971 RepID=A0A6H5ICW3_9HYME|nr:unnamed protein product [Trichogramma brassicae]